MYKLKPYAEPHLRGPEMFKHYKLVYTVNAWVIMGCKVARGVSEAAWVVLGGCPDYLVALRLYARLYWTDSDFVDHLRRLRDNSQK
jgi:hypothetical protein